MYSKKRDILAFLVFFIGIWSIPFWFPFIIESVVYFIFSLLNIDCNLTFISNIFICLYSVFSILIGFVIRDEKEKYMKLFSIVSVLIGVFAVVLLIFMR